jgi:hypothetical protein
MEGMSSGGSLAIGIAHLRATPLVTGGQDTHTHSLALKLQLLQCIWGFRDATSLSLLIGYESFLMDIGMYGNPFDLNYTHFSLLATAGTWFKNLWELLTDFDATATLGNECHLHPLRLGNSSLMFEFS